MQIELLEELVKDWYTEKNVVKSQEASARGLFRREAYRLMKQIGHLRRRSNALETGDENNMFKWIYDRYSDHLQKTNAIDFSSFIRYTNNILESCPEALDTLKMTFQYVLVDEFQDTDTGQFKLLQALTRKHQHITIVGDDDQQIYSWRGAAGVQNFTMFTSVFTGATVIKLERNFRSTGAIVAAARCVIEKNENRMEKSIRTTAHTGKLLTICECRNEVCEVAAIGDFILALKAEGVELHEVAVLYRLHRVGLELQHRLQARGIPCSLKSGHGTGDVGISSSAKGVTSTGEVFSDILAVLRLVLNELDDYACKRLLRLFCPDHLEISLCIARLQRVNGSSSLLQTIKTVRSHLLGIASCKDLSSYQWVQSILDNTNRLKELTHGMYVLLKIITDTKEELQKLGLRDVIKNILQQISPFREETRLANLQMTQQSKTVKTSGTFDFAGIKVLLKEAELFDAEDTKEDMSTQTGRTSYKDMRKHQRRDGSQHLVRLGSANKLRLFLDRVALKLHEYDLGESIEAIPQEVSRVVTLSTIHQAKGLEWTSVVLARANEGIIPIFDSDVGGEPNGSNARDGLEEERRLMYVSLTRAKRSILITHVMIDGRQQMLPSRFIADIPRGLSQRTVCYDATPSSQQDPAQGGAKRPLRNWDDLSRKRRGV